LIKEYAEEIRRLKAELAGQSPVIELQPTDDRIKEI
jgi:hypothetical protein